MELFTPRQFPLKRDPMYLLKLFGGALVEEADGSLSKLTSHRRPLALLALLASAPNRTLSREKLVGILWPESPERVARNRLTSCLYQVRAILGAESVLAIGGDLQLNGAVVGSDLGAFHAALLRGDAAEAVRLRRGPFLDGFHLEGSVEFEHWRERAGARLRALYRDALESLASGAEGESGPAAAVGWWRELAAEDAFDTRVACRLMEALDRSGNPAEALRVGAEHRRRLRDEFEIEPGDEFERVLERLREREPARPGPSSSREGGAGWAGAPVGVGSHPSPLAIAILPFRNLSGATELDALAQGLHDDLLTELSRYPSLRVISRTSVLRYHDGGRSIPEIARELGVGTVMEGGLQGAGGRLRLNVQVVDAVTGTHQWGDRFDRALDLESVLDLQAELAERIARALQAGLSARGPVGSRRAATADLEAYRLCAQGRRELDRRTDAGMRAAVASFRAALSRDPLYALAWSGLADAFLLLHDYGWEPADRVLPDAEAAVRRALELDPLSPEAHASLALLRGNRRDAYGAIEALQRAVELRAGYAEAHNWLSWTNQVLGNPVAALAHARRAVELDPVSPEAVSNLSGSSVANGLLEAALVEARRVRALQPDWTTGPFYEGLALHHMGRYTESVDVLDGLVVEWAGSGPRLTRALALVGAGSRDRAAAELAAFEHADDRWAAAVLHLALGNTARARDLFERVETWDYWPVLSLRLYDAALLERIRADGLYERLVRRAEHAWGGPPERQYA